MPFTPAHAAIVLPLIRLRYVSATALIMGSIAPDFEYFLKLSVNSQYSHTLSGIFYFDIPVAVFLAFLFHVIVKKNLIGNLPVSLQHRFHNTLVFDFLNYFRDHYLLFILSAGLGSASHIFWDSFTHANGFFVRELPIYEDTVVPYDGARYPLFYVLQHASTLIGLIAVVMYVLLMKKQPILRANKPRLMYWIVVLFITTGIVFIRFAIKNSDYTIGNLVVSGIAGFCVALILSGFITFKEVSIDSRLHG